MSEQRKQFDLKQLLSRLKTADYIAFAVFLGLAVWYCFVIGMGIAIQDESFYYTICERLSMGDRLFVDEWHVSQLSALFQYLPYQLFVAVSGGKEGLILCMRSMAVCVAIGMYWFVYLKLRKYHVFGNVAAFLIGIWFPGNLFHITYYNVPAFAMTIVCLTLFLNKKTLSLWKLILLGLCVAAAVMAQPLFVLIFILFSALCLLRKFKPHLLENYDFVLNAKVWRGITIGCAIAFVLVVGGIAIKSGIANVIQTIPELFTDSEYDFSLGGGHFQLVLKKLGRAFELYGGWWIGGALLTSVVAGFYRRSFFYRKDWKAILLALACLFFVAQIVHGLVVSFLTLSQNRFGEFAFSAFFYSIPGALFGFSCYSLCEKKNPRIFVIWLLSLMMSSLATFGSDVYMSISGPLSNITPFLCFKSLWDEGHDNLLLRKIGKGKSPAAVKKQKKMRTISKSLQVIAVIGVILLTCWGSFDFIVLGLNPYVEVQINQSERSSLTETIEKGPHKGIKTTKEVKQSYENILSDLDEIAAKSDGKPFYVAGLWCYDYLYLDLPIGTYSTWYVEPDSESGRQLRYWKLHPEKRPKFYYIPENTFGYIYKEGVVYDKDIQEKMTQSKLQFIQSITECDIKKGRAGYIVEIKQWK